MAVGISSGSVTEVDSGRGIWSPTFASEVTFAFVRAGWDPVSLRTEEIEGSEPEAGEVAFPELPIPFFGTSGMEKISSAIVIRDDS